MYCINAERRLGLCGDVELSAFATEANLYGLCAERVTATCCDDSFADLAL